MEPCKHCGVIHVRRCNELDLRVWREYLRIEKLLKRKWRFDIMQLTLKQAAKFHRRRQCSRQALAARQETLGDATPAVRRSMGEK